MATYFCPGCGKGLRYEDRESGYCPGCGKPLPASVAPAERARPEEPHRSATPDQEPRRSPAAELREASRQNARAELLAWGTVRAGLALTVFGGILVLVCGGVGLLWMVSELGNPIQLRETALEAVAKMVLLGLIALGAAMFLCGIYMAVAAPADSGAKGAAVACCAAVTLTLLLILVNHLVRHERSHSADILDAVRPPWGPFSEGEAKALEYGQLFMELIAVVSYCLFLRGVARFFNRDGLSAGVLAYLIVVLVSLIGMTAFALSEEFISDTMRWVLMGSIIALVVWFLVLVGLVRSAVTRGLLRAS